MNTETLEIPAMQTILHLKLTVFFIIMLVPSITLAQPMTYRNQPGTIKHHAATGVSGSFTLKADPAGTWSMGTGGGCLVEDVSASLGERRCVTNDDCIDYVDSFVAALPAGTTAEGAHGYCAQPDRSREPRRCWIRPGPQPEYCVVSPMSSLPLNQAVKIPSSPQSGVPVSKLGDGKKVRWMVLTCLNGFDFSQPTMGKDRLGCKSSDANQSTTLSGRAKTINP